MSTITFKIIAHWPTLEKTGRRVWTIASGRRFCIVGAESVEHGAELARAKAKASTTMTGAVPDILSVQPCLPIR